MVTHSLPSPPSEDSKSSHSPPLSTIPRKSSGSNTKSVKGTNRASKRAGSGAAAVHHHDQVTHGMDGRHKRVWKACERCRMKKTKCDGEFPCKRCKDDGLVCTAGVRKKMEYKQLPRGYAEVLENTQFALIATVHKLYQMVRTHQSWDLGEPEVNDRGQPVIHNIAQKLGCIRPNSDIDLPVHSIFPENTQDLEDLARQLNEHHAESDHHKGRDGELESESPYRRADRASSSDLDHSDIEPIDYRRAAFGGLNHPKTNGSSSSSNGQQPVNMSPQSYAGSGTEFEFGQSAPPSDLDASAALFSANSPPLPMFSDWPKTASIDVAAMQYFQQALHMTHPMMDGYETIKPQALSTPMMGMNDPLLYSRNESLIYSNFDIDGIPI